MTGHILGNRRCGTCKFAEPGDGGELECHHSPPGVYPLVTQGPGGAIALVGRITLWPQPKAENSCAQWALKIVVADKATFDADWDRRPLGGTLAR